LLLRVGWNTPLGAKFAFGQARWYFDGDDGFVPVKITEEKPEQSLQKLEQSLQKLKAIAAIFDSLMF
jgi:hypothetical protein